MLQANLLAFHIIAIVCWFAGLLYSGRLLIYAHEAQQRPDNERQLLHDQYVIMKRRLWFGITTPAMLATVVLGIVLMMRANIHHLPWFMLKMVLIIILLAYHFGCHFLIKAQARGRYRLSSLQLRLWNEVGTTLLLFIVLLAKHKSIVPALLTSIIACIVLGALFSIFASIRRRSTA